MSTILKRVPLAPRQGLTFPGGWRAVARALALAPVRLLILWQKRLHDRAALQSMSEHQRNDIGMGRLDALLEAEKPFWRA